MTISVVPVTTTPKPEVVGKAIYIELAPVTKFDSTGVEVPITSVWGGAKARKQIIFFQPTITQTGHKVDPMKFIRTISPFSPRAQWDWWAIDPMPAPQTILDAQEKEDASYLRYEYPTKEELEEMPEEVASSYFANSISQTLKDQILYTNREWNAEEGNWDYKGVVEAWKKVALFAVEVTDRDADDLHQLKTPQAVVRRINKTRESLGFPAKIV